MHTLTHIQSTDFSRWIVLMQCFSLIGAWCSIVFERHYSRENVGMHHSVTHNKDETARQKKKSALNHTETMKILLFVRRWRKKH